MRRAEPRRAKIDPKRGCRQRLPLVVVDAERVEQPPHTRSSDARKSAVTWPTSRTPVSRLNASSSVAAPAPSRISAEVPVVTCRPWLMMKIRVQMRSTTSRMCEREEDRLALRRQLLQELLHDHGGVRVETVERLVEDEHLGPVNQGGGEDDLLPHAFRELAAAAGRDARRDRTASSSSCRRVARGARLEVVETADELEVLVGGQRVVQRRRFRHVADALLHLERLLDDVEAGDQGAAAIRAGSGR